MIDVRDRYWVIHEDALVRALWRVWTDEITPGEAMAELEEHSESEEIEDG